MTFVRKLDKGNAVPEDEGYETHSHYQEVQQVEAAPTEAARMEDEPVGDNFKQAFNGKNCCKEVIKIIENLKKQSYKSGRVKSLSPYSSPSLS